MTGKCSTFGGLNDSGMMESEGLALYEHAEADTRPDLFRERSANEAEGTSKRLKEDSFYIALRFNKALHSRKIYQSLKYKVSNPANGKSTIAFLVDWGPNANTGRLVDLSPGLARFLEVQTDQEVEVEELSA